MRRKITFKQLCRRYSDGGAEGGTEQTTAASSVTETGTATQASAAVPAGQTQTTATETKSEPAAQTFSKADVDGAVQAALSKFKQEQENSKDYDKMTPEQKVAHLEAQMADKTLSELAVKKLGEAGLSAECLPFIKGKDEADTTGKITAFKTMYDAAVQAGIEKRFKDNGYNPNVGSTKQPTGSTGNSLEDAIAESLNLSK